LQDDIQLAKQILFLAETSRSHERDTL